MYENHHSQQVAPCGKYAALDESLARFLGNFILRDVESYFAIKS